MVLLVSGLTRTVSAIMNGTTSNAPKTEYEFKWNQTGDDVKAVFVNITGGFIGTVHDRNLTVRWYKNKDLTELDETETFEKN